MLAMLRGHCLSLGWIPMGIWDICFPFGLLPFGFDNLSAPLDWGTFSLRILVARLFWLPVELEASLALELDGDPGLPRAGHQVRAASSQSTKLLIQSFGGPRWPIIYSSLSPHGMSVKRVRA